MSDPHETTFSSPLPLQWLNEQRALAYMLVQSQPTTVVFSVQGTMALPQEHPIAPTPSLRFADDLYMLKLTWSLTPPDTESRSSGLTFTQQTPPAILARAYSLIREYHELSLSVNIEIQDLSNCSQMWGSRYIM